MVRRDSLRRLVREDLAQMRVAVGREVRIRDLFAEGWVLRNAAGGADQPYRTARRVVEPKAAARRCDVAVQALCEIRVDIVGGRKFRNVIRVIRGVRVKRRGHVQLIGPRREGAGRVGAHADLGTGGIAEDVAADIAAQFLVFLEGNGLNSLSKRLREGSLSRILRDGGAGRKGQRQQSSSQRAEC